ncbi:hypothetical protein K2173_006385 [Erythroxylum novogranatense]|uniref:Dof-type domain-containing protein n=1 Tax=Erythroxylum novogranatense TaxID=1862640 RepID=A0AAV8U5X9_9ROSI|nr:hypothetical protein K2173_006385 [Erythroxylum novogranatense]
MPDFKDSAIKLFGKTIPVLPLNLQEDGCCADQYTRCSGALENGGFSNTTCLRENLSEEKEVEEQDGCKEPTGEEIKDDHQEDGTSNPLMEDSGNQTASSGTSENPKTPSVERETSSLKSSKKIDQSEKSLKKPDKILPCPRCNSMDTKFCYYNNYNVNQPRHFCKSCQRYWTAGGNMRNVPVGAGRRKSKSSSASHYRQIIVSKGLQTAQVHPINGIHNYCWGNNGTVLNFGSNSPLGESVASILNLSKKTANGVRNGYHVADQNRFIFSCGGMADNGEENSSGSSVTASNSLDRRCNGVSQEANGEDYHGFPVQVPCFPGPAWACPWNTVKSQTTLSSSGFPVPFYPAPIHRGSTVQSVSAHLSLPQPCPPSSNPTSRLGKHSRDGNLLNPSHSEQSSGTGNSSNKSVVVPKTLRIDDPNEAAKSSIWATLGIKNDRSSSTNGVDLFKGFQSRTGIADCKGSSETSVLLANPAAWCRSLNFHERT